MSIVDLRGREGEPDVLELVEPDPAWTIVGWSEDDRLVACAGFERLSEDEVAVRGLGARSDDAARALLGAIARVATGARLVAEVDARTAGLYRSSGFTVEQVEPERVRCTLALEETEATATSIRSVTLQETEAAIRAAWGRDTSDDADEWSEENPARGQCAVTALLVRELLGGEILVANVLRDGRRVERHAWNRLDSGLTVDLTREQFTNGETFGEPAAEEPLLTHRNPERFETLRARVRSRLELDEKP